MGLGAKDGRCVRLPDSRACRGLFGADMLASPDVCLAGAARRQQCEWERNRSSPDCRGSEPCTAAHERGRDDKRADQLAKVLAGAVAGDIRPIPFRCRPERANRQVSAFGGREVRGAGDHLLDNEPVFDLPHEVVLRRVGTMRAAECRLAPPRAVQVGEQAARDDKRPLTEVGGPGVRDPRRDDPGGGFLDEVVNVVPVDTDGPEVAAQRSLDGRPGGREVGCNCCSGRVWTLWRGVSGVEVHGASPP